MHPPCRGPTENITAKKKSTQNEETTFSDHCSKACTNRNEKYCVHGLVDESSIIRRETMPKVYDRSHNKLYPSAAHHQPLNRRKLHLSSFSERKMFILLLSRLTCCIHLTFLILQIVAIYPRERTSPSLSIQHSMIIYPLLSCRPSTYYDGRNRTFRFGNMYPCQFRKAPSLTTTTCC